MGDEPFRQQPHTRAQGRAGEDEAVAWLRRRGYDIVERNFATKAGEIDVVARDGDTLCFIEIKARSSRTYGLAIEAVSRKKQRRLARAAAFYLLVHPTDSPCRFDVIGLDLGSDGWSYTLIQDAFMVPG
ncbi:MAG: YraN family protein [bacterium]|nr:YraN family protein [bacterium]